MDARYVMGVIKACVQRECRFCIGRPLRGRYVRDGGQTDA